MKNDHPIVIAAYLFCALVAIYAIGAGLYLLAIVPAFLSGMLFLFISAAENAERRILEAGKAARRELRSEIDELLHDRDLLLMALEKLTNAVEADKNPHGVSLINAAGEARELHEKMIA